MAREVGDYVDDLVLEDGEPQDLGAAFKLVNRACANLMWDRHSSYGAGNIRKFGIHGVAIRASDKLERITTMLFGTDPQAALTRIIEICNDDSNDLDIVRTVRLIAEGATGKKTGESVEDSFGDLSNYGVIGVLLNRGWWDLPLIQAERDDDTPSSDDLE